MKQSTRKRLAKAKLAPPAPSTDVQASTATDAHRAMLTYFSAALHEALPEIIHQAIYRCAMDAAGTFKCL